MAASQTGADAGAAPVRQPAGGRKAVFAAFAANLAIAATKFAAFVITGSAAMAAESIHSVADSGDQALLLIGRRRSLRDQTEEHQLAFGAERYFYAFIVEDSAALVGLGLAVIGVTLAVTTGNGRWDGAGSLAIGLLLGCVAVILAIEMKSLLIGESATKDAERSIVAALEEGPEVNRVIHLRTMHVGPDTLLVAAKIAVRAEDSAANVAEAIDQAERRIRAAVPIAQLIYLEPDLYEAGRADESDPAVRAARRVPRRGVIRGLRGRVR